MKKLLIALCAVSMSCLSICRAANVYIRDGDSGTGTSWSDARDNLPAVLTRGDTYYIADGSYGDYSFTTTESGTTWIYIKKATASDHGTETGWQAAYGDGQATWTEWVIDDEYYDIDGQVGAFGVGWPGYTPHGFVVLADCNVSECVRLGAGSGNPGANIRLAHVDISHSNSAGNWVEGADALFGAVRENITLSYLWIHNTGRVCIYINGGDNIVCEYSLLEENDQAEVDFPAEHSQITNWSDSGGPSYFRYNIIRRFGGTGGLTIRPAAHDVHVYGNVFTMDCEDCNGERVVGGFNEETPCTNVFIYNNTFYNLTQGGGISGGDFVNSVVRNNIFYNSTNNLGFLDVHPDFTYSHNWYYLIGTTDRSGESNVQIGTGSPFVNVSANDLRLTAATVAGQDVGAPYNTDPLGATRGADGTWDRGAYEYSSGAQATKAKSTGKIKLSGKGKL